MKPIQGLIERDIENERKPAWERHEAGYRRRDFY